MARIPLLLLVSLALGGAALFVAAFLFPSIFRRPTPAKDAPRGENAVVALAAGDSITAASYPDYLQTHFREAQLHVRVINAGVKGHTSGEYLHYLRSRDLLRRTDPDVVLLQLGTNDVRLDADHTETDRFYRQMNEILDRTLGYRNSRGRHPVVFLATIPPVVVPVRFQFDLSSSRRVTEEINPTIRRLARERNLPVVDVYDLFAKHPEWIPEIHPNEEGYRAMARLWFEILDPHVRQIVE